MKALTHLIQFPFDLFDGSFLLLWAVVALIAVAALVFGLKLIKGDWFWKSDPAAKEIASSTEAMGSPNFGSLKKSIDALRDRQDVLIERFVSVQEVLMNMQVQLADLKPRNASQGQHYIQQNDDHDRYRGSLRSNYANVSPTSLSTSGYGSPAEDGRADSSEMTDLYNVSRTDQSSRDRFREKYKPFFINVANDVDRRRNANVPPDFRKEADGSYLAVPRETDEAMIFPNFTLAVVDAVYGPGALAEVFDCGPFDRRFRYQSIRVVTPATFKLSGGQSWRLTQKGKLDLGPGQDA